VLTAKYAPPKRKTPKKVKAPKSQTSSVNSFNEEVEEEDYMQARLHEVCKDLNPLQIAKVFFLLLSRSYVNPRAHSAFQIHHDFGIDILGAFSYFNAYMWKKVGIIKEFLVYLIDYVDVRESIEKEKLQ